MSSYMTDIKVNLYYKSINKIKLCNFQGLYWGIGVQTFTESFPEVQSTKGLRTIMLNHLTKLTEM
jgi:hypothetical protein